MRDDDEGLGKSVLVRLEAYACCHRLSIVAAWDCAGAEEERLHLLTVTHVRVRKDDLGDTVVGDAILAYPR